MSIWIRAICTTSIGPLRDADLPDAAADGDWQRWATDKGLAASVGDAAERALRFEYLVEDKTNLALAYYRPDEPERFIRIERWVGAEAREEADEMAEDLAEVGEGAGATRVRAVLAAAVETIGFEMKGSDTEGVGWALSWWIARELAERGNGVVQGDVGAGEAWWDPETFAEILET